MRKLPRLPHRGIPKLSDYRGAKIHVVCDTCGMRRRYDAAQMLERVGDRPMPMLLFEIAKAEGCTRAGSRMGEPCGLHYDINAMDMKRR